MKDILEVIDVSYSYPNNHTTILDHISFSLSSGEFVAIVGPSGCGKSTLLNLICGLMKPTSGVISISGETNPLPSIHVGYMLQHDHLFEWRTIYKNIIIGLEIQHKLNNKTREKALELLHSYGLFDFKDAHPSELSGGMRQRVALIRTLVLNPQILLLDEPFSSLDYQTRIEVGSDISKIIRKENKTALLVTHDLSEAISLSDKIIILSKNPAKIQTIIKLSFSKEYNDPLSRRNTNEFKTYFSKVWEELTHET